METQCKACRSAHRNEIDARLLGGESARSVAKWVQEQGEHISHVALSAHLNLHLRVVQEAQKRIRAKPVVERGTSEAFEVEVQKVIANAELLDEIAGMAIGVARTFDTRPKDIAGVTLFSNCLREARSAVVAKHEILHGKKTNVDLGFSGLADLLALGQEPSESPGEEPTESVE